MLFILWYLKKLSLFLTVVWFGSSICFYIQAGHAWGPYVYNRYIAENEKFLITFLLTVYPCTGQPSIDEDKTLTLFQTDDLLWSMKGANFATSNLLFSFIAMLHRTRNPKFKSKSSLNKVNKKQLTFLSGCRYSPQNHARKTKQIRLHFKGILPQLIILEV